MSHPSSFSVSFSFWHAERGGVGGNDQFTIPHPLPATAPASLLRHWGPTIWVIIQGVTTAKGRHLRIHVINPISSLSQRTITRFCSFSPAVLPVFPVWVVVGIVTAVVVGLSLLTSVVLAVLYRRKSAKRDYTG